MLIDPATGARALLAHVATTPDDLWMHWHPDAGVVVALGCALLVYERGRRTGPEMRDVFFWTGMAVLAVALLSPLETVAGALASAHMVQHVLITTVAAPLLVISRPLGPLLRGLPGGRSRLGGRAGRSVVRLHRHVRGQVVLVGSAATATTWFWHARAPYELAVRSDGAHLAQHVSFLVVGLSVWTVVTAAWRTSRTSPGAVVLLLFVTGLQTTLLAALMTFAREPWYGVYESTTRPWGLDPLADQQLAGVLMWFTSGWVHAAAALAAVRLWVVGAPAARQAPTTGSIREKPLI